MVLEDFAWSLHGPRGLLSRTLHGPVDGWVPGGGWGERPDSIAEVIQSDLEDHARSSRGVLEDHARTMQSPRGPWPCTEGLSTITDWSISNPSSGWLAGMHGRSRICNK